MSCNLINIKLVDSSYKHVTGLPEAKSGVYWWHSLTIAKLLGITHGEACDRILFVEPNAQVSVVQVIGRKKDHSGLCITHKALTKLIEHYYPNGNPSAFNPDTLGYTVAPAGWIHSIEYAEQMDVTHAEVYAVLRELVDSVNVVRAITGSRAQGFWVKKDYACPVSFKTTNVPEGYKHSVEIAREFALRHSEIVPKLSALFPKRARTFAASFGINGKPTGGVIIPESEVNDRLDRLLREMNAESVKELSKLAAYDGIPTDEMIETAIATAKRNTKRGARRNYGLMGVPVGTVHTLELAPQLGMQHKELIAVLSSLMQTGEFDAMANVVPAVVTSSGSNTPKQGMCIKKTAINSDLFRNEYDKLYAVASADDSLKFWAGGM